MIGISEEPKGVRNHKGQYARAETMVIIYDLQENSVITVYWKVYPLAQTTGDFRTKDGKRQLDAQACQATITRRRNPNKSPRNGPR